MGHTLRKKLKTELFQHFKTFPTQPYGNFTKYPCLFTSHGASEVVTVPLISHVGVSLHCMNAPHRQGHVISTDEYSWPPNTTAQTTLTIVHGTLLIAYTFV
jgi:hypothetical protein